MSKKDSIIFGLVLQAFILALTSITTDFGVSFRYALIATPIYWAYIAIVHLSRRKLSVLDHILVRLGFLLACLGLVLYMKYAPPLF